MVFDSLIMTINDLVRIASAGGGFNIDCSKYTVLDIVRIANAASIGGGLVFLGNTSHFTLNDKVRIAAASKGHVIFNDLE